MKKFTLYVDKEKRIFAASEEEIILTKVEIEAESLDEAFKLFNPELYDKKEEGNQ